MQKFEDVELTSWKSGIGGEGDTYGFRITLSQRDIFYPEENPIWRTLTDNHVVTFSLPMVGENLVLGTETTNGFWDDCPEFRFTGNMGEQFKEWMKDFGGGLTWPERPHKYKAEVTVHENPKKTLIQIKEVIP